MANMSVTTCNPMGRWWHPLPLMSGIGLTLGCIIGKLIGMFPYSWLFIILAPLITDIVVNLALAGTMYVYWKIADVIDNRRKKPKF